MITVDIAKLVADAKRWPADWTPNIVDGEWCGSFDGVGATHDIETSTDTDYSVALGQFLADAVNAIQAIAALTAERDSLLAHVAAQDARIKGLEATIARHGDLCGCDAEHYPHRRLLGCKVRT